MFEDVYEEDARPMGASAMRAVVGPATSIQGYPGGSVETGMARVMGRTRSRYSEQPLLPGGSIESGMAAAMPALNPNMGYYDQAMFARGLTAADAYVQARAALCALSSSWCTASNAQILAHIQQDPTVFVCPNPIRCVLAPTTCTTAQCAGTPPPTADNTLYYVAGGVVLLALVALVLSRGPHRAAAPAPRG